MSCSFCESEAKKGQFVCRYCRRSLAASEIPVTTPEPMGSTKRCPFCAEEIQAEALVCRFCGKPPLSLELQALARQWWSLRKADQDRIWAGLSSSDRVLFKQVADGAPRRSSTPLYLALGCGGLAALGALFVMVLLATGSRDPKPAVDRVKHDAWYTCQGFVKNRLKAPSTAEFCRYQDSEVTVEGEKYRVVGCVDAQNSFGADIRSSFTCEVRASGDKWLLESIEIK